MTKMSVCHGCPSQLIILVQQQHLFINFPWIFELFSQHQSRNEHDRFEELKSHAPSTSLDSFIAVQERTMGEVALLLACFLSKGDYLEPLKSRLQGGLRAQDKDLLVEHELYGLLEAICLAAVHEKPISAIFSKEMEAHVGTLPRLPQARILELLGALDCREVSVIDRNSSSSTSFETPLPTSCQLSTYLEACKKCSRTWSRIFFVRNGSVITTDDDMSISGAKICRRVSMGNASSCCYSILYHFINTL